MKRVFALLISISLLLSLAACGAGGSEITNESGINNSSDGIIDNNNKIVEAPPKETDAPTEPLSDSGELKDCSITVGDAEFIEDYEGRSGILIHFSFTNTSEENITPAFSVTRKAFQNGIGLEDAHASDDAIHDSGNLTKKIQPGATIELTEFFLLSSDTAPVQFYIADSFSVDGRQVGKVYEVSPGGTTEVSVAPGMETATDMGRYAISINSYSIAEDYKGNPVLILNMGYTNNSSTDSPFYAAFTVTAFQEGIELEDAYYVEDDTNSGKKYLNVLPGAGHAVSEAFVLSSDTALVDIEIRPTFSWDDEKITTQIDITN